MFKDSLNVLSILKKAEIIREKLEDDISKDIFDARVALMMDGDVSAFNEIIDTCCGPWRSWGEEWEDIIRRNPNADTLVFYGAGHEGRRAYRFWKNSIYQNLNVVFCDKKANICEGVEVISPARLYEAYADAIVIITGMRYKDEILLELIENSFPREQILYPSDFGWMRGICGQQYFDFFEPASEEIFIDGGSFDGRTSKGFVQWCKGSYKKIYAFEPNHEQATIVSDHIEKWGIENVEVIRAGLWNESATLGFTLERTGSRVDSKGTVQIQVDSIDNVLKGEKVTLIKMDIEGSEYNAILGAAETIRKWHPRLAICIYHKMGDVLTLPALILELDSSYRLALRHYRNYPNETVLYAW